MLCIKVFGFTNQPKPFDKCQNKASTQLSHKIQQGMLPFVWGSTQKLQRALRIWGLHLASATFCFWFFYIWTWINSNQRAARSDSDRKGVSRPWISSGSKFATMLLWWLEANFKKLKRNSILIVSEANADMCFVCPWMLCVHMNDHCKNITTSAQSLNCFQL